MKNISESWVIASIILLTSLSFFFCLFYLHIKLNKNPIYKASSVKINEKEKKELLNFMLPLTALGFSGIFFGYVDTFMLGHYVSGAYISFYSIAIMLIGSVTPLVSFAPNSLLPLFAQINGSRLKKIFKKARNMTLLISIAAMAGTILLAPIGIGLYGTKYFTAVPILQFLSIMVVLIPVSSLYDGLLMSRKKTKTTAGLTIFSTVLLIILNFFLITFGLSMFGQIGAIYGVIIASIISRFCLLIGQVYFVNKYHFWD